MRTIVQVVLASLISAAAVFGTMYSFVPKPEPPVKWEQVLDQVRPSTVFITSQVLKPDPTDDKKTKKNWSRGSGFIISSDGYIVTNNHVTDGASKIQVSLDGSQWYDVKLIGGDEKTDVSVLKLDASNLKPIKVGPEVKQGEAVMAWGNPYGFYNTASTGIVSNSHTFMGEDPYFKIQTDAAINHGNSGGPLFNTRGEVVGMNQAIYSPGDGNAGIAFTIPIARVMDIAERLKVKGEIPRGFLGVSYTPLNSKLAEEIKVPAFLDGLVVAVVHKGSPAEKAGVQQGDLILAFDGVPTITDNYRAFARAVSDRAPGYPMSLKIIRAGKSMDIVVPLGKWVNEIPAADPPKEVPQIGPKDKKK